MKQTMTPLAALLAGLAAAAPASAQDYGSLPEPTAQGDPAKRGEASRLGKSDDSQAQQATTTTGRKFKLSDKFRAAVVELQNAVKAKDAAAIPARLAAAQGLAKQPDEKYLTGILQTQAGFDANDLALAQAGIQLMQESGVATNDELVSRWAELGRRFRAANQVDAASTALDRALALDPGHVGALKLLALTRESQGRNAEAVAAMQKAFAAAKAAGKPVPENELKYAVGIAHKAKLPTATATAREWVDAYPTSSNWHAALRIHRDIANPQGVAYLDHMRMALAAGGLETMAEYYNFASELFEAGHQAEAKAVLAAAAAKGVGVNAPEFKDLASRLTDVPTRAKVDAAAKTALAGTSAKAAIDAGDAYYGIGAYAEAAAAYRAALGKSGVDSNLANLRLGAALARSGDKAGATAALKAVSGAQAETAKFWLVWLGTNA